MEAINKTEQQLQDISGYDHLSKEEKEKLIQAMAYPPQNGKLVAGGACMQCSDPLAREAFVTHLLSQLKGYSVTVYAAYPGTPLNDDNGYPETNKETGKRETSKAGHMWLQICLWQGDALEPLADNSYGFAPKGGGIIGDGSVSRFDTKHYENPYYRRRLEITLTHYQQLQAYGESAVKGENPNFELYYHGTNNSCIDFTWKTLRSAGLRPTKAAGKFEGSLKVIDNIPHIQTIPAPFAKSGLNFEHYHEKPARSPLQWLLTQEEIYQDGIEYS